VSALPFGPPIEPMLAKLQRDLPPGDGWLFEPKWDGFRSLVFNDGQDVYVQSRDLKPLNRYFPELVPVLAEDLPDRCVVDGEIVVPGPDGALDFDMLQMRIHPAESRIRMLSKQTPSSFIAFDLLAEDDEDLRKVPFSERRARLEAALKKAADPSRRRLKGTQILLTPQTDDPEEAEGRFEGLSRLSVEGVVAKRPEMAYRPGDRAMVKVKRVKTADCVVGGYRVSKSGKGVGSLLLGLYDDGGVLHFVGHTSSFKAQERIHIQEMLRPLEKQESFGKGRTPGGPSRWTQREDPWISVRPVLVCEVQYDKLQGDRFRHASTFVRWRKDRDPRSCTFEQIQR
jgi:ATP-dependent DNA ligase